MQLGRSTGSAPRMWTANPCGCATPRCLNSRGGIECDLTVTRLAPDRYYIVTGTGFITP